MMEDSSLTIAPLLTLITFDIYKRVPFDPKSLTTKLEIVISFVAAVDRKFIQGR
jgi:hypothetical protein